MAPKDTPPGLRSFLEQGLGLKLDPELIGRLEKGLGTKIDDDPDRWRDVERNLAAMAGEDDPMVACETVQPVFERLLDEVAAARPERPIEVLPGWSAGERAILATRVVSGEIDNGGAPAVVYDAVGQLLPDAIDGFRLLGLAEHADALAGLVASGFNGDSPDGADDDFHETWFSLPDTVPAQAAYITAHPDEFRS
jgi:hypothetical protein